MSELFRIGTGESIGLIAHDSCVGDTITYTPTDNPKAAAQYVVVGRELVARTYPAPVGVLLYVAPTHATGDPLDRKRVWLGECLFANPCATWEEIEREVFTLAHPIRPASRTDELSAQDASLVLTSTERWVIREMLSVARIDAAGGKPEYFVHKCQKNGLAKSQAQALADAFDIDVLDELWGKYREAQQ